MREYTLHIKWALLLLGTLLCWQVFERVSGWHDVRLYLHFQFSFIHFLFMVIFYYLALKEINETHIEESGPNRLFLHGLILTLIICLLLPFTLWLLYNYISPDYVDNVINYKMDMEGMQLRNLEEMYNSKSLLTKIPFIIAVEGLVLSYLYSLWFGRIHQNQQL